MHLRAARMLRATTLRPRDGEARWLFAVGLADRIHAQELNLKGFSNL